MGTQPSATDKYPSVKIVSRHFRLSTSLLLLFGILTAPIWAFSLQYGSIKSGPTKQVDLILHLRAKHDGVGGPIVRSDLQLSESGHNLQILGDPKSARPREVVFLVDSNFHQREVFPLEIQTVTEILQTFQKWGTQSSIVSYGSQIHTSGEPTDHFDELRQFAMSLQPENDPHKHQILLWDSLKLAFQTLANETETATVILLAEGNDEGSSIGWNELARIAQHSHITCYVILFADHSFRGTKSIRRYGWELAELAPKTGGQMLEVGKSRSRAQKAIEKVITVLDTSVLIQVVPVSDHKALHRIKITSSRYKVLSQAGYFDDATQ
jgi:hypothetical protein